MGWFPSGCTTSVLIQQGSWDLAIHRRWECIAPSSVVLSHLWSGYQQAQCLVRTVPWPSCLSTADRTKGKYAPLLVWDHLSITAQQPPEAPPLHIITLTIKYFFIVCECVSVWGVGKGTFYTCLWRSDDNPVALVRSFNLYMRPGSWTQATTDLSHWSHSLASIHKFRETHSLWPMVSEQ